MAKTQRGSQVTWKRPSKACWFEVSWVEADGGEARLVWVGARWAKEISAKLKAQGMGRVTIKPLSRGQA